MLRRFFLLTTSMVLLAIAGVVIAKMSQSNKLYSYLVTCSFRSSHVVSQNFLDFSVILHQRNLIVQIGFSDYPIDDKSFLEASKLNPDFYLSRSLHFEHFIVDDRDISPKWAVSRGVLTLESFKAEQYAILDTKVKQMTIAVPYLTTLSVLFVVVSILLATLFNCRIQRFGRGFPVERIDETKGDANLL